MIATMVFFVGLFIACPAATAIGLCLIGYGPWTQNYSDLKAPRG